MKIKIEYQNGSNKNFPYQASALLNDNAFVSISEVSFEDAKKQLIEKIKRSFDKKDLPEPEEVEI